MKFNNLHKTAFLTAIIFVMASGVFAQSDVSSPYSRFGLGTMSQNKTNTILQGMGGINNAVDGMYLLNNSNPASLAEMDTLTFLFDAGFYMKYITYKNASATEKGSNASFDYFDIGFGITKWWKMGAGVTPYSNREYSSTADFDFQYPYSIDYEGSGGLNKIYWANGFKVFKGLSLGVKMNYVFGNVTDETTLYFPDYANFHNERRTINLSISDVLFDFGLIYKQNFNKDYQLAVGLTYSLQSDMGGHRNTYIRTMFKGYGSNTETARDTILYKSGEKVGIVYPQGFGGGITLRKGERWLIGVDFNWDNWKSFKMNGSNDSLQNAWSVAVGGCYTPRYTSVSSYMRRVTYRAGFHYDQTFFNIYGISINKYGVSFGVGLPVPRAMSSLNLAFEFGKMGTIKNDLIEESYFNISLGISIRDRWFVKRRYK